MRSKVTSLFERCVEARGCSSTSASILKLVPLTNTKATVPYLSDLHQVTNPTSSHFRGMAHISLKRFRNEPIAVIGSACRFPGAINSPSKLWALLREPRDLLSKVPATRFNADAFFHPDGAHHGTSNVTESYFLEEDPRLFDAAFFNIKPVEAHSIDPQHRVLLEVVFESLEASGQTIEGLASSQTGVYVGLMTGDFAEHLQRDVDTFPAYTGTGTARSLLSNRISYFFDWHGPSMTIDTACSSSLVAVHEAVQLLRSGDSDLAVAAGSNLIFGPELYIGESKLKMLSPTGRSRMWDANADGYARGEGVASVVLKRLSDAVRDGDHIECIIRESSINSDGRTKGLTMPNERAQADLITRTYKKAGLDPTKEEERCQYFEAHGTGTEAGDCRVRSSRTCCGCIWLTQLDMWYLGSRRYEPGLLWTRRFHGAEAGHQDVCRLHQDGHRPHRGNGGSGWVAQGLAGSATRDHSSQHAL